MTQKMESMFSSYKLLGFLKKGYQDTFVDNLDLLNDLKLLKSCAMMLHNLCKNVVANLCQEPIYFGLSLILAR